MDILEKRWIEKVLSKLDFVSWDRYIEYSEHGSLVIFGWIDRKKDSYKDFVILEFTLKKHKTPSLVYFLGTSSYEYSERIAGILGSIHYDCHRVESAFTIDNVVKKPTTKKEMEK